MKTGYPQVQILSKVYDREDTLRKIPPLLEPLDVTERECLTVSAVNSWEFQNIQDGDLIGYISISSSPSCGQSLVHAGKEIR